MFQIVVRASSLCFFGALFSILLTLCLVAESGASDLSIRLTGKTAKGHAHDVTMEQIDAIGVTAERVYNPYEKLQVRYAGVLLDRFVEAFGAPSVQSVRIRAIDDYQAEFDRSEWERFRILLVTRLRGERFGFEMKGPARIVYPDFDPDQEAFQISLPKWIWMIQEVEFR